ncbi:hypothetical protein ACO1NI_14065, partial [Staphylococcus aureus]
ADALMTAADTDRDGRLSFDEFSAIVETRPELLAKMTRSEAMWIAPSEELLARLETGGGRPRRLERFFENEWPTVVVVFLWLLV